jgi:hypothetical protein
LKRADFIKLWSDTVDQGRLKKYPDMRPSERAFSRMDDDKMAVQIWRKHRPNLTVMTREEVIAAILPKPEVTP